MTHQKEETDSLGYDFTEVSLLDTEISALRSEISDLRQDVTEMRTEMYKTLTFILEQIKKIAQVPASVQAAAAPVPASVQAAAPVQASVQASVQAAAPIQASVQATEPKIVHRITRIRKTNHIEDHLLQFQSETKNSLIYTSPTLNSKLYLPTVVGKPGGVIRHTITLKVFQGQAPDQQSYNLTLHKLSKRTGDDPYNVSWGSGCLYLPQRYREYQYLHIVFV